MRIEVLAPEVASKIAAGEVVERPASAAKELIENAIDAGASDITIEIRQGGQRLIKVTDNGCGIPADQAELAFARHSTSKLRTVEDLDHITTLGFRGEALASIAAVSQLTLTTRAADEEVGTRLHLEGLSLRHRESIGAPAGTTISVENLYFNTPARRKFLRSEATEASRIAEAVTSYALAYPEIRFTFLNGGRTALQTLGTGELHDVIVKVFGVGVAQRMLRVEDEVEGIAVRGFVSAPELNRADRKGLLLFVNRRWIQDRSLTYAVEEAYRGLLLQDRRPLAVLNIRLDPEQLDVNIHPTKREIRFRDSRAVFAAIQRTVRRALQDQAPIPTATPAIQVSSANWEQAPLSRPLAGAPFPAEFGLELQRTLDRPEDVVEGLLPVHRPTERLPMLRVLGQLAQTYIIAEGPGGMYLIDQHAAHERIVFERLMAEQGTSGIVIQPLLEPLVIELLPAQSAALEGHADEMAQLGFEVQPFGVNTWRIEAIPASLNHAEIGPAFLEILSRSELDSRQWYEEALLSVVCHSAVRAGQTLSMEEMRDLVRQLERANTPHSCPHGRPTMIHLSAAQLERQFGRR